MGKLAVLTALAFLLGACGGSRSEEARYCYKTLARVDCYAAPLDGQEGRLVGFYDEVSN